MARYLASEIGAVYLRIDTLEQTIKNIGFDVNCDEGYQVTFALAADNLKNGVSVVADSINPVDESRRAWCDVASKAHSAYKEIEVFCSNQSEQRARIETRKSDIPHLRLPDWQSVLDRDYQPWITAQYRIDTANQTPVQSKAQLLRLLNINTQ
ncbi:AAA family ATPase [Pseudoalteromonas byunsanensis]